MESGWGCRGIGGWNADTVCVVVAVAADGGRLIQYDVATVCDVVVAPIVGRANRGPVSHTVQEITVFPLEFESNCNYIELVTQYWNGGRAQRTGVRTDRRSVATTTIAMPPNCVSCSSLTALPPEDVTSGARVRRCGGRDGRFRFAQARARQAWCSTHLFATPWRARSWVGRSLISNTPGGDRTGRFCRSSAIQSRASRGLYHDNKLFRDNSNSNNGDTIPWAIRYFRASVTI